MEWSGVLFYNVEGELGSPGFKCIAEELYLMDIGTSAYTEYEYGPDVIKHMMENKHLLKMKKGHIHSHNRMSVFFSTTDTTELMENSEHHNYYLSLIVNNDNDMTAKIAFHGVQKSLTIELKEKEPGTETPKTVVIADESPVIYTQDCNIILPGKINYDDFSGRISELKSKKEVTGFSKSFQKPFHEQEREEDLTGSGVPKVLYGFLTSWISGNYGTAKPLSAIIDYIATSMDSKMHTSMIRDLKASVGRFYEYSYPGDRSKMGFKKVLRQAHEVMNNYNHVDKKVVAKIKEAITDLIDYEYAD